MIKKILLMILIMLLGSVGVMGALNANDVTHYYSFDTNYNDSVGLIDFNQTNANISTATPKLGTGAAFFDDNGDYADTIGYLPDDVFEAVNTLCAWVYPLSYSVPGDGNTLFSGGIGGGAGRYYVWDVCIYHNGMTAPLYGTGHNTSSPVGYKLFCIVDDGSQSNVYFNGVTYGTNGSTGMLRENQGVFRLGGLYDLNGQWYYGYIDELLIFNTSLSSDDMVELYNSGDGLQYPFEEDTPSLSFYNEAPANNTEYGFTSNSTIEFSFNITSDTDMWDCNLTRNGSIVSSGSFNSSEGVQTLNDTFDEEINWTSYHYGMVCNSSGVNITDTNKTINVIADFTGPVINFITPADEEVLYLSNSSPNLTISVSVNDTNLYNSTFTLYYPNGSIRNTTNIFHNLSYEFYQYNFSENFLYILPADDYVFHVTTCDGHTGEIISLYDVDKDKDSRYISYNHDDIKVTLIDDITLNRIDSVKSLDRYSFEFYLDDKSVMQRTLTFRVDSKYMIRHLISDKYKGWMVTGPYWIDFNLKDDKTAKYSVNRLTDISWTVSVTTSLSTLIFESIGELNCVSENITFSVSDYAGNVSVSVNESPAYIFQNLSLDWAYSDNNPDTVYFEFNCSNSTTIYTNTTHFSRSYVYETDNVTYDCSLYLWANDTYNNISTELFMFNITDFNGSIDLNISNTTIYVNDTSLITWYYDDNNPDTALLNITYNGSEVYSNTSPTGSYNLTCNYTGTYMINFTANDTEGTVFTLTGNITVSEAYEALPGNYTVGVCPSDTAGMLGLIIMLSFCLILVYFMFRYSVGVLGLFSGIGLLIFSWYFSGCVSIFAYLIALFGVIIIIWSIVIAPEGFRKKS